MPVIEERTQEANGNMKRWYKSLVIRVKQSKTMRYFIPIKLAKD